jgi:hypothetical protein
MVRHQRLFILILRPTHGGGPRLETARMPPVFPLQTHHTILKITLSQIAANVTLREPSADMKALRPRNKPG